MNLAPATLIVAEGNKVEAMAMVVALLELTHDSEALEVHREMVTILQVDGAQELGDAQWHYGVYPLSSLEKTRAGAGIQSCEGHRAGTGVAREAGKTRRAEEAKRGQEGRIRRHDTGNCQQYYAQCRYHAPRKAADFRVPPDVRIVLQGEFKYDIAIDMARTGAFTLKTTVVPFLAPVKAQDFEGEAAATKN
jgi:hypothetical protein